MNFGISGHDGIKPLRVSFQPSRSVDPQDPLLGPLKTQQPFYRRAEELRTPFPNQPLKESDLLCTYKAAGPQYIKVEEAGNPHGIPVILLHGGPGWWPALSKNSTGDYQFFDPKRYRTLTIHQPGCGYSSPSGINSHTSLRVFDGLGVQEMIDTVSQVKRAYCGDVQPILAGFSWGATLAHLCLQYAPHDFAGTLTGSSFIGSEQELADFYTGTLVKRLSPELGDLRQKAWDMYVDYPRQVDPKRYAHLREEVEAGDWRQLFKAYKDLVIDRDDRFACRIWANFEEFVTSTGKDQLDAYQLIEGAYDPKKRPHLKLSEFEDFDRTQTFWQLRLFEHLPSLKHIHNPEQLGDKVIRFLHGENDTVCPEKYPLEYAEALRHTVPGLDIKFVGIPGSGHARVEGVYTDELIKASDDIADTLESRRMESERLSTPFQLI